MSENFSAPSNLTSFLNIQLKFPSRLSAKTSSLTSWGIWWGWPHGDMPVSPACFLLHINFLPGSNIPTCFLTYFVAVFSYCTAVPDDLSCPPAPGKDKLRVFISASGLPVELWPEPPTLGHRSLEASPSSKASSSSYIFCVK